MPSSTSRPKSWSEFLDRECGDDEALRAHVQRLLDAQAEIGSFMAHPEAGVEPTIDQPITEGPGTVIGPYKLLQKIGEGGFGVVYMADQKEPVQDLGRKTRERLRSLGILTSESRFPHLECRSIP